MANQGIYREAGVAAGLPLPRARITGLTVVVAVLALLAIVMPLVLLGVIGHSMSGTWRLFKEGGGSMYLLLLLELAMPIAVATLGAFVLRGKRVPSGLLFGAAALPFAVTLLGAWSGQRLVLSVLGSEAIDSEQRARILAEGIAESMSVDIFGGFVGCGVAIVAAAAASLALASVDVAMIVRGGPKPSSSLGTFGPATAGAAWILATIAIGIVRMRNAGGTVLLPVLPLFVLVPCAVLAGRSTPVLRAWHDRGEASRGAALVVIAMLSALLALFALQRGIESSFTARAFSAISGESIDPSQRARILGSAIDAGRLASVSSAIHLVFGTATFALALAPALGNGGSPLTASTAIAAAIAVVLLGGTASLAHSRTVAPRILDAHDAAPRGVRLPIVVSTFSDKSSGTASGERIVIAKDGTSDGDLSKTTSCAGQHATVYADADATLAMVMAKLPPPKSCMTQIALVAKRNHAPEIEARLGDYAAYLGTSAYFGALVADPSANDGDALRVKSVADDAIEIDGVRVAFPVPSNATTAGAAKAERHAARVAYSFRPTDTVDHAVAVMMAVETLEEDRLSTWSLVRAISVDDGTVQAQGPGFPAWNYNVSGGGNTPSPSGREDNKSKPVLRAGAIQVNGRLPPEVIQRIVRQNFGRLRFCYETALLKSPQLAGRVSVKFVIDRSGSVSTATDGGSDLSDRTAVACVLNAFSSMSFPQPEGGIVTVFYPIVFSPT